MPEHEASRTLVKSPPELWAECSDAAALARHLGAFGEITITKLEPETAVAWEGEEIRGTVTLEPSGWGTRVILTAVSQSPAGTTVPAEATSQTEPPAPSEPPAAFHPAPIDPDPVVTAVDEPEPSEPAPASSTPEAGPRPGFFARLFGSRRRGDAVKVLAEEPTPGASSEPPAPEEPAEPVADVRAEPVPQAPPPGSDATAALVDALNSLGRAHHRPFSRG